MSKPQEVIRFYILCNKLKDVVRTGWKIWHVQRERLESVAEHIYGVQMLAIAMWSEYQYEINIEKVIMMLAVHELEEIGIGDFAPFQISEDKKLQKGHAAVEEVLSGLMQRDKVRALVLEFDERVTLESKFAGWCDKLEADLQCRLYDEAGGISLGNQKGNPLMDLECVQNNIARENGSVSGMWLSFNQAKYNYDHNFKEVADYAHDHKINSLE